jgi:hypothetical protein
LFPILLCGGVLLAIVLAIRTPGPFTIAAVLYGLVGVSLKFDTVWGHVANGQRTTFELFILLALCSVRFHEYPRWLRVGVLVFWAGAAAYMFIGTYDADFIRKAIVYPLG